MAAGVRNIPCGLPHVLCMCAVDDEERLTAAYIKLSGVVVGLSVRGGRVARDGPASSGTLLHCAYCLVLGWWCVHTGSWV